ncbi:hypothetical protein F4778DRAFT_796733 [Xylariomycetidae sp. FL2044]|nr:hypothetical protein F4778DRAFT_796733 [Xylariomycetidae sp. FL2044]
MGRTEPSITRPPQAFRRDARAKRARATLNKVIPALLVAHPRARRGIENAELIVDPPPVHRRGHQHGVSGHEDDHGHAAESTGEGSGGKFGNKDRKKKKEKEKKKRRNQNEGKLVGASRNAAGDDSNRGLETATRRRREERDNHDEDPPPPATPPPYQPRLFLETTDALTSAHNLVFRKTNLSPPPPSSSSDPATRPTSSSNNNNHKNSTNKNSTNKKVALLNMASPLTPGGGFLNGATSPEEFLCMRTTLLPSLRDEFYRLPELGVVWTGDVLVFRRGSSGAPVGPDRDEEGGGGGGKREKDVLGKSDRWFVNVLTAAAIRGPETVMMTTVEVEVEVGGTSGGTGTDDDDNDDDDNDDDGDNDHGRGRRGEARYAYVYTREADREMMRRKMRAVMRVCARKGVNRLVLGAWGCGGAGGNPVGEVARAWRRVLCPSASSPSSSSPKSPSYPSSSATTTTTTTGMEKGNNNNKKKNKAQKNGVVNVVETWPGIEEIVFAIRDPGVAEAFHKAFGEDLLVPRDVRRENQQEEKGDEDGEEEDDEEEDDDDDHVDNKRKMRELRDKIREVEMGMEMARSPQLKAGLASVLAGLRGRQMPRDDDGGGGDGDDDDDDGGAGDGGE